MRVDYYEFTVGPAHGFRPARASSTMRHRSIVARLAASLVLASVGCGGEEAGGGSGEVGVFDLDAAQAPDVSVGELAVTVSPGSTSLCLGECTTLSAQAKGGRAPYAFQWDHGLGSGEGAVRVCPDATTTYVVAASDSSGHSSGELQSADRTGSASVTVTVAASCSADGGHGDLGSTETGSDDSGPAVYGLDDASTCINTGSAPWSGCEMISVGTSNPDPDADLGWCTLPSTNFTPYSTGLCLPKPMLAGRAYAVNVSYTLTNVTGPTPQSAIFGSTQLCAMSQNLLPLQTWPILTPYTGSFSLSACVTADANYPVLLLETVQQMYSSIPADLVTIEICNGCAADP